MIMTLSSIKLQKIINSLYYYHFSHTVSHKRFNLSVMYKALRYRWQQLVQSLPQGSFYM